MADSSGNITDLLRFTAWGEPIERIGTTPITHQYTGEYRERTGLQFHRARWYQPEIGRWTQMDEWLGAIGKPLTLNKYLGLDGNPAHLVDPSGLNSLQEQSQVSHIQSSLQSQAGANTSRQFAGKAANQAGKHFEKKIEDAIRQCLKPNARLDKPGMLQTNDGRNAMPDFLLIAGESMKYLELKTKLPTASLGDSLGRAAKQLQAAIDNGAPIGLLTKTKHRDGTFSKRTEDIKKLTNDGANMATFLNGTMSLVSFVSEFVVEECLENALR